MAGIELWMAFVCVMGEGRLIMMIIMMGGGQAKAIPCEGCDDAVWTMKLLFEVRLSASKRPLKQSLPASESQEGAFLLNFLSRLTSTMRYPSERETATRDQSSRSGKHVSPRLR